MPAGTIVASGSLVSPGGQQGIPGPNAVSSDAGNIATWGSDGRLYVPDPASEITSVRLRSYNAIGNASFEVDQRNVGNTVANAGGLIIDRWSSGADVAVSAQSAVTDTSWGTVSIATGTGPNAWRANIDADTGW